MLSQFQTGKTIRRQVRDSSQKMVIKVFHIQQHLIKGEYWEVMHVIDQDTMQNCTLKIIQKKENMSKERKNQIFNEIQNQRKMSGRQQFIDLLAVYEDSHTVYLLMEKWGTPLEKIIEKRRTLMQKEVQLIFCQLVDILERLRSENITHGSITLYSVLLSPKNPNQLQLTNFSHSLDLSSVQALSSKQHFKISSSQTQQLPKQQLDLSDSNIQMDETEYPKSKDDEYQRIQYTSPEQNYHDRENNKLNLSQRDIWSCGVLLFKLLTGVFPFTNQKGNLVSNRIKNATFSFPQLTSTTITSDLLQQTHFKHSFLKDYISSQWKQLLKKMMTFSQRRITIKQLTNHPLKQPFIELKSTISNLEGSQPSLSNMFSVKVKSSSSLYAKSWSINYEGDEGEDEEESECLRVQNKENYQLRQSGNVGKQKASVEEVQPHRQRPSKIIENLRETSIKQTKMFRIHKTAFNSPNDSAQHIQNGRHETVGHLHKQKNHKDSQISLNSPFTLKPNDFQSQKKYSVSKQPIYISKFKYFKKQNWLGYIFNNLVGVILNDGQHIIGTNKNQFKYIEDGLQMDSEILTDQPENISQGNYGNLVTAAKKSMYRHQPRFTPNQSIYIHQGQNKRCSKNAPNFKSQQISTKDFNFDIEEMALKFTRSDLVSSSEKSFTVPKQKYQIYEKAINYFGERVVKGNFDLWVDKFWRDGNVFIFLLSNGCWQVAFQEYKGFRIYAVDENNIGWAQNNQQSPDILFRVRQIIQQYRLKSKKE